MKIRSTKQFYIANVCKQLNLKTNQISYDKFNISLPLNYENTFEFYSE